MEDVERFRVRKLKDELNENLRTVLKDLNEDQRTLFKEEDDRMGVLSDLEKVHKELQGEHIQDMVAGGELTRKQTIIRRDYAVGRQGLDTEKELLRKQIEHIEATLSQVKGFIGDEETSGKEIQAQADEREDVNAKGLSEKGKDLIQSNEKLGGSLGDKLKDWDKEKSNTTGILKEHEAIVGRYNESIDRFRAALQKLLDDKNTLFEDKTKTQEELFTRLSSRDQLNHEKSQSSQEVDHLSAEYEIYKIEMSTLETQYETFLKKLRVKVDDQEAELKKVKDEFRDQETEISRLNTTLR